MFRPIPHSLRLIFVSVSLRLPDVGKDTNVSPGGKVMEYSSLSLFRTTATYTWLSDLLITRPPRS